MISLAKMYEREVNKRENSLFFGLLSQRSRREQLPASECSLIDHREEEGDHLEWM